MAVKFENVHFLSLVLFKKSKEFKKNLKKNVENGKNFAFNQSIHKFTYAPELYTRLN